MEEKSVDQLRLEAQELYQSKLRAFNDSKNTPKKTTTERTIKPADFKTAYTDESPADTSKTEKPQEQRNNRFIVTVFSLMVLIVIMKLFMLDT